MEFSLRPLGFLEFLLNIYSLYNSSILDIEHSPYYIALGSPQTNKGI